MNNSHLFLPYSTECFRECFVSHSEAGTAAGTEGWPKAGYGVGDEAGIGPQAGENLKLYKKLETKKN